MRGICNVTWGYSSKNYPVCNLSTTLYMSEHFISRMRANSSHVMCTKTTRDECAYAKAQGSARQDLHMIPARVCVHTRLYNNVCHPRKFRAYLWRSICGCVSVWFMTIGNVLYNHVLSVHKAQDAVEYNLSNRAEEEAINSFRVISDR